MRIVVLDGYTLNPGDLSWAGLEALGPTTVYDRTPPDQIAARAAEGEIVLTNKTVLSREIIRQLPRLRYIGVLATGYNVVDLEAARERNVPVTNVPNYGSTSVVQMVFAHLLNLTQHVAEHGQGSGGRPLDPERRLLLLGLSAGGTGGADDGDRRLRADRPGRGGDCPSVRHERAGVRRMPAAGSNAGQASASSAWKNCSARATW